MKTVTSQQLADLKNAPTVIYLVEFEIGATTYRLTNADYAVDFNSNNYIPGLFDEIDEIEITTAPKTNDTEIQMYDADDSIMTLLLSQSYMNKSLKITKLFYKDDSIIMSINAFEGLISDYEIKPEDSEVSINVSSVWADDKKLSGIKTNPKSQQRFFPLDTSFEWSAQAQNTIYWGKRGPSAATETPPVVLPPGPEIIA